MREYVCGFAISESTSSVLLVEKRQPQWQDGKLNGIGGKVEPEDTTLASAMHREFLEETTINVPPEEWELFSTTSVKNAEGHTEILIYFFRTGLSLGQMIDVNGKLNDVGEVLRVRNIRYMLAQAPTELVYNLPWLLLLALHRPAGWNLHTYTEEGRTSG